MYVLIHNGAVKTYPYSVDQLRLDHPDISFPSDVPEQTLADFGVYRVVSVGPPAFDPNLQIAVQSGCAFNQELCRWETDWVVRSKTDEELNRSVLEQIIQLESSVTDRRLREAVLGVDGGWLENLNSQISDLRSKLK